ncbi:MAG: spermidine synthase, partial [Nitrospinota bacterium]
SWKAKRYLLPLFYLLIFMLLTGAAAFLVKPEFQGEEEEEKKPTLATKHKLALFIAGINLTLLQYFITREFSSLLSANELTILIVASAYFVGFSIGYGLSRFFSLRFLQITAPVLFLLHFCIFLTLKFIAGFFIRAGFNLEVLVLLLFVASFLTSSFYSMLLPRFISSAGRNSLISYYSWELMGAITGAATMFFVIVRFPTILWPIYFALFLILIFLLTPKSRFFPAYLAIGIFLIAFQFRYQERISHLVTEDYYQTRGYRNPRLLFSGNSFYHSIDVLDTYREKTRTRKERRTSFINGIRYFSYKFDESGNFDKETSLSEFTYFLAELPARYLHQELGRKLRILILGGGSLYSIARVNEFAERTTLVEIDPLVIESSTKYWKNINRLEEMEAAEIIIDDAKHYLKTSSEKFDLIVMDISAPYYLGTMLLHNRSFFELVKKRLKPGGIFSESTQSRPKPYRFNSSAMKILKGIVDVFPHYRVLDAYKKPRGRRGFVYASSSFPFSTEKLNTILKKDGLFRGTALYSPENHHYNFDKVTPFSLTNMETLLTGNMGRFKRRLSLEQRLHSKSFFKKRKRRLRRMEFHSLDYVTQIFKENFFLLGALSAAFFSLIGFFYYGKRAEKEAL